MLGIGKKILLCKLTKCYLVQAEHTHDTSSHFSLDMIVIYKDF